MNDEAFTRERPRLHAIAYRMLGSVAEAEDVLQDAYLRWHARAATIETPPAWLTTTVTNLCLDRLKSARAKREVYVGPWLPEPLATTADDVDPESVSTAFLVLLERLTPVERAVYLLHVVFEQSHEHIAIMLGKQEPAVRQALHRAKEHVERERPRFAPSKARHAELLGTFLHACRSADLASLERVLAEDASAWTDGGGKVPAAGRVVHGRNKVARFFLGLLRKLGDAALAGLTFEHSELNGWPAVIVRAGSQVYCTCGIETDGELVRAVHCVLNPDKLGSLGTWHPWGQA